MTRRSTVARLAAASGLFAASWVCAGLAWERPHGLVADTAVQTLGPVRQQSVCATTFRLANHTGQPLEIIDVVRSCTCTDAKVAKQQLAPGEETELRAELSVGARRGVVQSSVEVLWKGPDDQVLRRLPVRLMAKVAPHYSVSPERLEFEMNDQTDTRVTIASKFGALRLLDAFSTHEGLSIASIDEIETSREWSVFVRFNPIEWGADEGSAEIVLKSDSLWEPELRIPIRVARRRS